MRCEKIDLYYGICEVFCFLGGFKKKMLSVSFAGLLTVFRDCDL